MSNRFAASALFLFSMFSLDVILAESAYAQAEKRQTEDCTRSTPAPVIKKSVFPETTFKLSRDKHTGTETVKFVNGDRLTITNAGCEYYYLSFKFESDRFSARAAGTKYWFKQAVEFIKQIEKGVDAPVQMADAVKALKKYIKETPKFGEEIDYGGADIRMFVIINRIKKLPGRKPVLEIAFAIGPL